MPTPAAAVPAVILDLVERFERNLSAYHAPEYNETQLRREFLDPFFEALGWDVNNRLGHAEQYKDVIHEDSIRVEGAAKAPDYAFRVGGTRKFFVEAKKPAVNIRDGVSPAYQLRRYAWSAKLPVSILTDFEEFAVYDCRSRPDQNDKAATGRVLLLSFRDYPERWGEIAAIFSRDAILKGAFDQYAGSVAGKKGTAEVDDAFLQEIERWRDLLARNFANRNPNYFTPRPGWPARQCQELLNYAVQRTIDRLIFLRICEDRGIEDYGRLQAAARGKGIYPALFDLFRQADARYNSGLFHFTPGEKGGDTFTPALTLDDRVLKEVIQDLYYPHSPYVFSEIPADILGQVYERFLGKVIRLTPGGQARVEEKPEVRKAGGVYYTPTYIVDYIVRHTLDPLLEGRAVNAAKPLRVLDMACGSGSFLIGAYQYLLDWYLAQYTAADPAAWARKKNPPIFQDARGAWRLTTTERKRILVEHVYGVDIDPQAVEVTRLSLLLKVLEGESAQTIGQQLSLFKERALPDLDHNVQCGNSLIGPDFYSGQLSLLQDEEARARVNIFDWPAAFPEIFQDGGFDAVIGNPPYIRIQTLKEWAPLEVEFYKRRYKAAAKGNYDIYVVFVEKGLELLNPQGRLGYILPHKFFNAQYGEAIRGFISKGKYLSHIVHFGALQVFGNATTYTCLMFLDKNGCDGFDFHKVIDINAWRINGDSVKGRIGTQKSTNAEWNFAVGEGVGLIDRLQQISTRLGDIADIFVGIQTSADDVYILEYKGEYQGYLRLYSKALDQNWIFEKHLLFPLISGTDVNRYQPLPYRQYLLFPYVVGNGSSHLLDFNFISINYPKTAEYLNMNKKRLEAREKGRMKGPAWYGYIYLKNLSRQSIEKLCVPRLVNSLFATYDNGEHFLDNVDVGGITLRTNNDILDLRFLLGLINSRLLRWYFPIISAPFRGGWLSANRQFLSQLPIIVPQNKSDETTKLIELVDYMLQLHRNIAEALIPDQKQSLQRQIDATDREIDRLVYQLYGLSEDEIRIVEGG